MWVCPWLLPLQNSSPSLSVTVVDSRLFPQMAQRKQVLCQGCSSREGMVKRRKTGNPRHKTMLEEHVSALWGRQLAPSRLPSPSRLRRRLRSSGSSGPSSQTWKTWRRQEEECETWSWKISGCRVRNQLGLAGNPLSGRVVATYPRACRSGS